MSVDTVLVQDAMGEKVGKFIQLASSFFGGFVVTFFWGWKYLCHDVMYSTCCAICGTVGYCYNQNGILRTNNLFRSSRYCGRNHILNKNGGIFNRRETGVNKYSESLTKAYKASVLEGFASGMGMGATFGMVYVGYTKGTWYGSKLILKSGYTSADVINVIVGAVTGSMALGQASPCTSVFAAGQVAALKMFHTINRKPKIDAYDSLPAKYWTTFGEIELRDVYFSYPARPEERIFSGFSLFIPSCRNLAGNSLNGSIPYSISQMTSLQYF